jgi:phosphatidylglycerophosphate synthase
VFDRYLRTLKDRLFAPLARAIGPAVSPNAITWAAFIVGIASAVAALMAHDRLGLALWLLNRALDGLDGTQARVHARGSRFGAYLDIVLDFVVYAAIPLAMAVAGGREVALATVILLASFYVNAASWMYLAALLEQAREGAVARQEVTTVTMPPGLVAGAETVIFYCLFFLLPRQRVWLFNAMAVLVFINVGVRLFWARRHLDVRGAR